MKENFSAIILAAGYSGRMGHHKALLRFDSKRCFARKIADEFIAFGCSNVIMVTNRLVVNEIESGDYGLDDIIVVNNSKPEVGRFYSLYLAAQNIPPNSYTFIINADNPFVTPIVLRHLWDQRMKAEYICPAYIGKGGHPILVSPKIISEIKSKTDFDVNLKEFLNTFTKHYVNIDDERILVNINSPDDYQKLFLR